MTAGKTTNFLNPAKRNELLSFWCKENLLPADYKRWQKQLVNYATMEEVKKFIFANKSDYKQQIEEKNIKNVSEEQIVLDKDYKYLKLVFFNSAHYYDVDNHQPIDNRFIFRQKLKQERDDVKTCVIFGGDLFGTEWKMRDFNNAKFSDNKDGTRDFIYTSDEGKVVYYYGLNKRMKELETDILYALNSGAEVYLMRGAEEHDIYQATGRNILKEVFERLQNALAKKENLTFNVSNLHYIREGASLKINVARYKDDGTVVYGNIGLQTNNTDKSFTAQGTIKAAEKSNGQLNCDVRFVTNTNTAGNIGGNTYYVSPQAKYLRMPHKKKPIEAPRDFDSFLLSMEEPHNICVRVGDFVPDINNTLEYEEHVEEYKNKVLFEIAQRKLLDKHNGCVLGRE